MTIRARRLLTYLVLAAACYGVGLTAGVEAAFIVFIIVGGICELLFWKELFFPARR